MCIQTFVSNIQTYYERLILKSSKYSTSFQKFNTNFVFVKEYITKQTGVSNQFIFLSPIAEIVHIICFPAQREILFSLIHNRKWFALSIWHFLKHEKIKNQTKYQAAEDSACLLLHAMKFKTGPLRQETVTSVFGECCITSCFHAT